MASGHLAGATRYCIQRTGALRPPCWGRGRLPATPTGDSLARPPESYTSLRYQALPGVKRKKKAYRLQMTLRIGLPVERVGDPGRAPKCYAQVMKSPSDHQGADTDAKAREFLLPSSSWGSHRYRHRGYREES